MARTRKHVELIVEAAAEAPHPSANRLAAWVEREDLRLDDARAGQLRLMDGFQETVRRAPSDEFMLHGIFAPMLDLATQHARAGVEGVRFPTVRVPEERRGARFRDEIEAMRALYQAGCRCRPGDFERFRAKLLLGSTVQSSTRLAGAGDPHLEVVGRIAAQVDAAVDVEDLKPVRPVRLITARRLFEATYFELHKPFNLLSKGKVVGARGAIGAMTLAKMIREGEGYAPPDSTIVLGKETSAAILVADAFGLVPDDASPASYPAFGAPVARVVSEVRRQLRQRMIATEVDGATPRYLMHRAGERL